mmetsp:Transcript_50493/g.96451  ORF Transcript_50493/g.96451 Transcript_50493/m.96451 type:complete len:479 (+) Transcript_50493:2254-3690(+)
MSGYLRRTKETYVKVYVKCVGGYINSGSTYTLSYELDDMESKVVGSVYTKTSNPFVLIEGLEDGEHELTVTCMENQYSYTSALPASDVTETHPVKFKWIVDTTTTAEIEFTSAPPDYTNHNTFSISAKGSLPASSYISSIAWTCSTRKSGRDPHYVSCGCGNSQSCTAQIDQAKEDDGEYSFHMKMVVTYFTSCTTSSVYCTDLAAKTVVKGTTWVRDTEDPELAVTSTPAAKSVFTSGKTAKFEFACKAGERTKCSYECMLDGMDSDDANDSGRARGPFSCTSPLRLKVANSTTHSFTARAVDQAGNTSPWSHLYMFYADGTPPVVHFTKMDSTTASDSQLLAASSTYYANNNDFDIATGARLFLATGSVAALDELNFNYADASYSTATDVLKVIEYTTSSGGTSSTGVAGSSAKSSYHTVLQFPYDPAKAVYELDGTYGAILAMKQVNSKFYYNVLDTTNADFGTLNFECSHPEMA